MYRFGLTLQRTHTYSKLFDNGLKSHTTVKYVKYAITVKWNAVSDKAEDQRQGYKLVNILLPICLYIWT